MSNKPSWKKFDRLFVGETPRSIINELDFEVDYAVESKAESALNRAWRRWQHAEIIFGDQQQQL